MLGIAQRVLPETKGDFMRAWLVFSLSAALFWGAYVPTIFYGQQAFGSTNPNRSMRAFLFIGLAYFVMAIVVPGLWVWQHPSPADTGFTLTGGLLSTLAGALGAAGALCVVFALRAAALDHPRFIIYVAPIVFTGAPIINVLISYLVDYIKGKAVAPHPMFLVGLLLAMAGTATVLLFNPAAHAPPKPSSPATVTSATQ
jgi:hypothetical protein